MKLFSVKFIENHPPYLKGEIAGFPERRAEALVSRGYAVSLESADPKAAAKLKALRDAPETRHIPGPAETKGAGSTRKCGECGKPGHTKANCPDLESGE